MSERIERIFLSDRWSIDMTYFKENLQFCEDVYSIIAAIDHLCGTRGSWKNYIPAASGSFCLFNDDKYHFEYHCGKCKEVLPDDLLIKFETIFFMKKLGEGNEI